MRTPPVLQSAFLAIGFRLSRRYFAPCLPGYLLRILFPGPVYHLSCGVHIPSYLPCRR